jgi:hypothetical protein
MTISVSVLEDKQQQQQLQLQRPIQGSLHCAMDDEAAHRFGRDDVALV